MSPDSIQEQGTLMCKLEPPDFLCDGAGDESTLVPK